MNSTEIVALIGAVATVGAATIGYVFNYLAGQRVHEANRNLAVERHEHERELAEKAQAHERRLRQGDRAYEDRKATYRQVGNWALVTAQQVQATEPILKRKGDPEPPPDLSPEEWSNMLVEVGLFGSLDVSEAMEEFRTKVQGFSARLGVYRTLRDQNAPLGESGTEMLNARGEVTTAYERLTAAMRDELASL